MIHRTDPYRDLAESTLAFMQRFGVQPADVALDDHVRNFHEEVRELTEAAQAGDDAGHIAEEAADVLVTLINVCFAAGLTLDQMVEGVYRVAAKNDGKTHETHAVVDGKIRRRVPKTSANA